MRIGKAILILLGVVVLVGAIAGFTFLGTYNGIVSNANAVEQKASDIDAQLQRRIDLVPNLVEVAKSYAQHETDVFDSVTQARQALMDATTVEEKAAADSQLTTALGGIVAIAEAYPELKSDTVYVDLMDELAGTENRIAYSRTEYNAAVGDYNTSIQQFPGVVVAKMFGFEKQSYFEAAAEADRPLSVDMSLK